MSNNGAPHPNIVQVYILDTFIIGFAESPNYQGSYTPQDIVGFPAEIATSLIERGLAKPWPAPAAPPEPAPAA